MKFSEICIEKKVQKKHGLRRRLSHTHQGMPHYEAPKNSLKAYAFMG